MSLPELQALEEAEPGYSLINKAVPPKPLSSSPVSKVSCSAAREGQSRGSCPGSMEEELARSRQAECEAEAKARARGRAQGSGAPWDISVRMSMRLLSPDR